MYERDIERDFFTACGPGAKCSPECPSRYDLPGFGYCRGARFNNDAYKRGADRLSRVTCSELLTILDAANNQCELCGDDESMEIDHVVPLYHGGPHHTRNLRALCKACNRRLGRALLQVA